MKTTKTFLVTLCLFPALAHAWGAVGHRTIGLLAQERLNPQAAAWVQNLLGKETLADVASWADNVRGNGSYRQTTWYHFEKISDSTRFLDHVQGLPDWQKAKGGIITAILEAEQVLRDSSRPQTERADALRFLVHFVGDLHQPLHSGRPEDNGGSKIRLDWNGTETTLHHVWDTSMIQTGHADIIDLIDLESGLPNSTRRYADWLTRNFEKARFQTENNLEAWLDESLQIRTGAYDPLYRDNQAEYQRQHLPEVDQRIFVAGLRLARMVNELADQVPASDLEKTFRRDLEKILGALDQLISFRP